MSLYNAPMLLGYSVILNEVKNLNYNKTIQKHRCARNGVFTYHFIKEGGMYALKLQNFKFLVYFLRYFSSHFCMSVGGRMQQIRG